MKNITGNVEGKAYIIRQETLLCVCKAMDITLFLIVLLLTRIYFYFASLGSYKEVPYISVALCLTLLVVLSIDFLLTPKRFSQFPTLQKVVVRLLLIFLPIAFYLEALYLYRVAWAEIGIKMILSWDKWLILDPYVDWWSFNVLRIIIILQFISAGFKILIFREHKASGGFVRERRLEKE